MSNTTNFYAMLEPLFAAHRRATAQHMEISEYHSDILEMKGLHVETMAMLGVGKRTAAYTNGECYQSLVDAWPYYRAELIQRINGGLATKHDLQRAYRYYQYAEALLAKYANVQRVQSVGVASEQQSLF